MNQLQKYTPAPLSIRPSSGNFIGEALLSVFIGPVCDLIGECFSSAANSYKDIEIARIREEGRTTRHYIDKKYGK